MRASWNVHGPDPQDDGDDDTPDSLGGIARPPPKLLAAMQCRQEAQGQGWRLLVTR